MKGFEMSAEQADIHNARVEQWNKNTLPVKSADVFKRGNVAQNSPRATGATTGKENDTLPVPMGARAVQGKCGVSKYRNKKVAVDGILFDSVKEANRWMQLKAMQTRAEISDLRRQVIFVLAPAVVLDGRKKPILKYVSDFAYVKNGKQVVEDVKSAHTKTLPVYRIKKHLLFSVCGVEILEI